MRRFLPLFALLTLALASSAAAADMPQYDPTVCADHTDGSTLGDACAQMVAAYPTPPELTPVDQDKYTLDTYSFWRVGPDPIPTFDAANGNPIGEIAHGFNFVRAINLSVDDWIQIE